MKINGVNRTERGWAGHFIGANECRFRRNTLLEYEDKKLVVSTVGSYCNPRGTVETIGHERWYETMVFEGCEENGYIEANVNKPIQVDGDWGIWGKTWEEVLANHPTPDNAANDLHEKIVEQMIERIRKETDK